MIFKGFRTNCIVRVSMILASCLLFVFLLGSGQYVTLCFLGAVIVLQTVLLIRYVEYTNRGLDLFLKSIELSDYSQRLYPGPAGRSFSDLRLTFENIMGRFRDMSAAREEDLRYLHALVEHVAIGLIAYDQEELVILCNRSVKSLLDVPHLRRLEDLDAVNPDLTRRIRDIQPGVGDLVTLSVNDELLQLSVHATQLRRRKSSVTLVSLQNINLELNEKELEAWQNLIRVLTHEIKNSLTPIASLAASVEQMVGTGDEAAAGKEALQVIQKRSRGLLQFVDTYRDLTHIPKPVIKLFPVADLLSRVENLIAPQTADKAVHLKSSIRPSEMRLTADPELIEQVLINLVLNSIAATDGVEGAKIEIEAHYDSRSRPVIMVSDNGHGIIKDSLEKVFVPFYSTRKTGSGVGLSLSRQIMRLHRGNLTVRSEPDVKTTFTLRF